MTTEAPSAAECEALIAASRTPAIAMVTGPGPNQPGAPGCWFGGEPTLPPNIDWPYYVHETGLAVPMHFLVQINLAELPGVPGLPPLPPTGTLFVFYDPAVAPMASGESGEEPTPMVLGTGCKVIHVDSDVSSVAARTPPPMPDLSDVMLSIGYEGTSAFQKCAVSFQVIDTYPETGEALPDACWDQLAELAEARSETIESVVEDLGGAWSGALHTIFGASRMRYFPTEAFLRLSGNEKYPALTPDHVLLFRFEEDEAVEHNYVDAYPISFWITASDLDDRSFDCVVVWKDL